ncbi:Auxin response factor 17 [Abeliophyllum distichum]|uniref:Auxin response factor 17 n=1 Tax=Abeliophyllum distichum TaxID=126358 RepID=A0ABD1S9Y0_9LAMI
MSASATHMDPAIWRATAGAAVQIPTVNSRVYYFPQGHLEHSSPVRNSNIFLKTPLMISCQVLFVSFLSDPSSDQPFANFSLLPLQSRAQHLITDSVEKRELDESDVVSFAKILTPSDANNGGGFSVPRFCADSIFPRLDFLTDPPVQNLIIYDKSEQCMGVSAHLSRHSAPPFADHRLEPVREQQAACCWRFSGFYAEKIDWRIVCRD